MSVDDSSLPFASSIPCSVAADTVVVRVHNEGMSSDSRSPFRYIFTGAVLPPQKREAKRERSMSASRSEQCTEKQI